MKSSNTKEPLFIYSSSATLESFLMLPFHIRIYPHDLTHLQHNSLSTQPCHIVQRRNTSISFFIVPNYTATISQHPNAIAASINISTIL